MAKVGKNNMLSYEMEQIHPSLSLSVLLTSFLTLYLEQSPVFGTGWQVHAAPAHLPCQPSSAPFDPNSKWRHRGCRLLHGLVSQKPDWADTSLPGHRTCRVLFTWGWFLEELSDKTASKIRFQSNTVSKRSPWQTIKQEPKFDLLFFTKKKQKNSSWGQYHHQHQRPAICCRAWRCQTHRLSLPPNVEPSWRAINMHFTAVM